MHPSSTTAVPIQQALHAIGVTSHSPLLHTLFELTWARDSDGVIALLQQENPRLKGELFEHYLGLLYYFNGFGVRVTRNGKDDGIDLFIYDEQEQLQRLVSVKNWATALDKPNTLKEVALLEEYINNTPSTHPPYREIFSLSGFSKEAHAYKRYRLKLSDAPSLKTLIKTATPLRPQKPPLDLKPHNQEAVAALVKKLPSQKRLCVCHATGTGKSYIIADLIRQSSGRVLLCGPSHYIFEQFEKQFPLLWNRVIPCTYQALANTQPNMQDVTHIVLDEFHRCGADKWGKGIETLLRNAPSLPVIGTSATPIRYLDGERNMAAELFDSQVVSSITLPEAIVRKLLPKPTYIAALYDIDSDIDDLHQQVADSRKTSAEKDACFKELEAIRVNWRKTKRMDRILSRYLSTDAKKIIVFFEDTAHMNSMKGTLQNWFWDAFKETIVLYDVYSKQTPKENKDALERFRAADTSKPSRHILCAIDMLNEGIHSSDVGAILLLRKTQSPRLYYQQIGRCMQVDAAQNPLVFDLVNNCKHIKSTPFIADCEEALEKENQKRATDGLEPVTQAVVIHDEIKDSYKILSRFQENLYPWNVWYDTLKAFRAENPGRWPTPGEEYNGHKLGNWCDRQKQDKKKNTLSEERVALLDNIGFVWNTLEQAWQENYDTLTTFRAENPSRWPEQREKYNGHNLGIWCNNQRQAKKNNTLSEERVALLHHIGFF